MFSSKKDIHESTRQNYQAWSACQDIGGKQLNEY